jgi:hypothetical protein
MRLHDAIAFLLRYKQANPTARKADIERVFARELSPRKDRSVYIGDGYSMRFAEANTPSFSNVVLSLSALQKYDSAPMVVCIVRPTRVDFRLANATFLRRISHSSHNLRTDNIRGSFLGHDIMDQFEGTSNIPTHFDELFAIHREFTWSENVERLVEATNAIVARQTRFPIDSEALAQLLEAPARAAVAITTAAFEKAGQQLAALIVRHQDELLEAAALNNVNIRGNTIEQIITGEVNAHRLDDLIFELGDSSRLVVDIKTKLLDRASAPKAYNIDKVLQLLSDPKNVFCLFFVGINVAQHVVRTRLVSIFDPVILKATRVQTHWAGRASRGVTQLTGDLSGISPRIITPRSMS